MISQECYELGSKSSVIREIFSYGLKRTARIKSMISAWAIPAFRLRNP